MQHEENQALTNICFKHAGECLAQQKSFWNLKITKTIQVDPNMQYFNAMRTVLTLDRIDMRHHICIISDFFTDFYIEAGEFKTKL